MKSIKLIASVLFLSMTWTSCIKDEELNSEADIVKCILPEDILTRHDIDLYKPFDSKLNAYPINLPIKTGVDVSQLALEFELTPGASIEPASGSVHNFRNPVRYTVTSEDGKWHRTYAIIADAAKQIPTKFHFEEAKTDGKYHILYELDGDKELTWGSGNGGFALAVSKAKPEEYPTLLSSEGYKGNCVKMITRSTGSLGLLVGMPIASGNLFSGQFNIKDAMERPLEATKFGEPFTYKPLRITGYYRYKSGPVYYDKSTKVDGKKDMCNIYAIFYESTKETPMLDGNIQETNFQHPNMVASALLKNPHETKGNNWERFDIEFDYETYGKEIDMNKLESGKYHLGIVFAASVDGAKFSGAPGSTLMIDEVEIIYE